MNLETVQEAELKRMRRKCEIERSSVCDAMIAAGRGHELASETLAKAQLPDADALTLRFARVSREFGLVADEERRRMEYHGSLKRIRTAGILKRYAAFNP